jgi:Ca2+-binding RTX toxin-like protein
LQSTPGRCDSSRGRGIDIKEDSAWRQAIENGMETPMTKHVLSANRKKTWEVTTSNDTWIIDKGVTLSVHRDSAILQDSSRRHDNLYRVLGDIVVHSGNGFDLSGRHETVYVAAKATIDVTIAGNGIAFGGKSWQATVENHGSILAETDGINFAATTPPSGKDYHNTLDNYGRIVAGGNGVFNMIDDVTINNHAGATIKAFLGVSLGNGRLTLDNDGSIISTGTYAITSAFGADTVTNSGTIKGNIDLGTGADTFTNKGGTVSGTINGNYGDDLYIVDRKLHLVEDDQTGVDTVKSSVDWTLGANFENLVLTGTSALKGTGNTGDNVITGNGADNIITGLGGADTLRGKGGADTFVFASGSGTDTIADFTHGTDHIDLKSYTGIHSTADFISIVDDGSDAVISLAGSDTIRLTGVSSAVLGASDFIFA